MPARQAVDLVLIASVALLAAGAPARAQLICGPFATVTLAAPEPRPGALAQRRFKRIQDAAKAHSYRVMFLGDSLTQRWDEVAANHPIWNRYFRPLDALNAGVNGDRAEHLLWRIEHGNLDNQNPQAVVLLIGTNDLGRRRAPEEAAEGVRRILVKLREALPETRILLEGLWPRSDRSSLTAEIEPVNRMIRRCADGGRIVYADPGHVLADDAGALRRDLAPDGLHPSPAGYAIVSPEIAKALAPLLAGR